MSTDWHFQGFVVAVGIVVGLSLISLTAEADYQVDLVDSPITPHTILRDDLLPPVCRPVGDVSLHDCRGQALPVSFVVTTSNPLVQV